MDVQVVWKERRVSCPRGTGSRATAFHVDELGCEWCEANRDDP